MLLFASQSAGRRRAPVPKTAAKPKKKRSVKRGLPPGTLVHIGDAPTNGVTISAIEYDANTFKEQTLTNVGECAGLRDSGNVAWINVDGLHDLNIVETLGNVFGLHPLVLEDIVNTTQRPKIEDFEGYLFIVLKMIRIDQATGLLDVEQVSLIVSRTYVISFQEKEGDVFQPIRERLRNGKGRIRRMGADYLAYALLDALVDNYFVIIEEMGERIEVMEDEVISRPDSQLLQRINQIKRDLITIRRSVWPLREVISAMQRETYDVIVPDTIIYLRDVYDHTIQVVDVIETFRDMVAGTIDIYLSSLSNRLNEVMKFLTIIGTIFIPLTFIVGIYGMNFEFMPELEWQLGYPAVMLFMLTMSLTMLMYFRRKGWI